jgi:hypothetical protein
LNDSVTAAEVLRSHYASNGLPADGGLSATRWTFLKLGPVAIHLGNLQWRRRALQCHDLHHLLTGYPCDRAGELQIATWEFAAGRFPNTLSTLFCLPLVGIGAVGLPNRTFAAYVRGRRSKTLYALPLTPDLLASSVQELRRRLLPRVQPTATLGDFLGFLGLAGLSLALTATPILLFLILFLNLG